MKFSFAKHTKKFFLGVVLAASCLGMAAVGFAEAKAYENDTVLRGSYVHTMRNEFCIRNANLYNNVSNSWGEVIVREESGMDGSVTRSWMIGDLKLGADNNFVFNIKRLVTQKSDNRGNVKMHKVEDVNYNVNAYHRMESGVKLEWNGKGKGLYPDIDGEYITSNEYPLMSSEAAMYVLERYMNGVPSYRNKLQGAAMQPENAGLAEVHNIKLVEHHPDHVVTRGTYQVTAAGTILEYDVIMDRWSELVH